MPGLFDPFTPGVDQTPFAGIDPQTFEQTKAQWNTFLGQPQGRAALLSMGLALMQPPSFGDNPTSQIGRAIGSGGEAVNRVEAMDIKKQEADSKAELRGSQALAAEARADAATARGGQQGAMLDLKREQLAAQGLRHDANINLAQEKLKGLNLRSLLGAQIRIGNAYAGYVKDVAKANEAARFSGAPLQTPMTKEQWLEKNPEFKALTTALSPTPATPASEDDEDTAIPSTSPSTTSQLPAPAAQPQAAPPAASRVIGQVYQTPRGPLKWTGTGWISP